MNAHVSLDVVNHFAWWSALMAFPVPEPELMLVALAGPRQTTKPSHCYALEVLFRDFCTRAKSSIRLFSILGLFGLLLGQLFGVRFGWFLFGLFPLFGLL
jgi:hypothetical protein